MIKYEEKKIKSQCGHVIMRNLHAGKKSNSVKCEKKNSGWWSNKKTLEENYCKKNCKVQLTLNF